MTTDEKIEKIQQELKQLSQKQVELEKEFRVEQEFRVWLTDQRGVGGGTFAGHNP
jgi:hypothetical protein